MHSVRIAFCTFLGALIVGCSTWAERKAAVQSPPTPPPNLDEIEEARRQQSEAEVQLKPPVQKLHDCYFAYVRAHALATTAPADIIQAARFGCREESVRLRSAVELHLLATAKVNSLTREGPVKTAAEVARLAEDVVDNRIDQMEPSALDLIVKLRTPAQPN